MPTASHDSPRASGAASRASAPLDPAQLEAWLVEEPEAPLRVGPGRVTFAARGTNGAEVIVKRFRGTPRGERLRARLTLEARRSPGRREYDALVALAELGLPLPRALGWHEVGEDSLVVQERVPFDETLRERLTRRPQDAAHFRPAVEAIALQLHAAGWYHRDLYLDHFLVRGDGPETTLIDVGRARHGTAPRARWFVKDLAALQHSTPAAVGPRPRLRLLASWLDARGVTGRRARRRWARAILRKAQRMAAHVPRGGTSFPEPEAAP